MDTYKFFWIASSKYFAEARHSAESVCVYHPDADLTLFAVGGGAGQPGVFTRVIDFGHLDVKYWFLASAQYMKNALGSYSQNDKVVYLDTDTHVCAPLDGLFEALEFFDFLGAHAPGRQTAPTVEPITDAFPEYNIGVNGFFVSVRLFAFLSNWVARYKKYQDTYRNNDQAPLREAIWRGYWDNLTFGTLPTEYNFRFQMGGQVREKVKVLHGRSNDYDKLCEVVNQNERKIRAWKPGELS